jgi:hypothetical protein
VGLTNLGSESETCVGSHVHLVGVSISFEKNFYRLPFTPPPSLVRRIGPSILQYADGTVIFLDHDLKQAKTLKLLLCAFEQLSVLKINFHKSEVFCCGAAREMEDSYTPLFGCNSGDYLSDI